MSTWTQVREITLMNLRSIPERLGPSLVIVVGIAGVVGVLVALMSMSAGLTQTLGSGGRVDQAVVTRGGANGELASFLSVASVTLVKQDPAIARAEDGTPLASGELIELMVTTGYFAVAEAADEMAASLSGLAGYVCADVVGDVGQVIRLAVHPAAQRLGIGRTLLNEALAYCQANGASRVVINTQEDNTASSGLYEQAGFRRVGRRVPLLVRRLVEPATEASQFPNRRPL